MIESIELNTVPFDDKPQRLTELKKFNYFFGGNATGKTTISKVVANPDMYQDCSIIWADGFPLESRVYNIDFIKLNLQSKIPGVFTLGEKESAVLEKIELIKKDKDKLSDEIKNLTSTLQGQDGNGGKKADLDGLKTTYKDMFWVQKKKHEKNLGGGLKGYLSNSAKFMEKVLFEAENNKEILLPLAELEEKAATIFSESLEPASPITGISANNILGHEKNPILQKRIIGKEDVDIAAMIKKLGNSDWVREGRAYYEASEGICPFCQQETTKYFENSLNEYFDEAFLHDNTAVDELVSEYDNDAQQIQRQIQNLIGLESEFLDAEKLKSEKEKLDSIITINKQRLREKQKETSQAISLESLSRVLNKIIDLITKANAGIEERNTIINNLDKEKGTLTNQIWRFIVEETSADVVEYKRQETNLESAINNLSNQIEEKKDEKEKKDRELRELEGQTTSIQPTKDGINQLLSSFGFKNFKLDISRDTKSYKLIRENGAEAGQTLSEGERNFVAFLYFYYLLKGSQNETGLTNNKIVVFDDPISSLDNEVMFIVSTLIREILGDVRDKKGTVKQVFVLTHNIYFHKEVTYNNTRSNGILSEETFWLVKKNGKNSSVEKQSTNPIKTSYELLWSEIKNDTRNNATIQNTMRRILENYFKLLGNIPLDKLYEKFDGENKLMCKALCSWVNDGSHSAFDDDFYTPLDEAMVGKYLDVFRQIFEKSNQISHYNMMMGI